jgi:hypothetical protein
MPARPVFMHVSMESKDRNELCAGLPPYLSRDILDISRNRVVTVLLCPFGFFALNNRKYLVIRQWRTAVV